MTRSELVFRSISVSENKQTNTKQNLEATEINIRTTGANISRILKKNMGVFQKYTFSHKINKVYVRICKVTIIQTVLYIFIWKTNFKFGSSFKE